MLGFCAILPGKRVAVGERWEWKGDLLNIARCSGLVATFELAGVERRDGKTLARITGSIDKGWPEGVKASLRVELVFWVEEGLPLSGSMEYASKSRTSKIETRASWE